MENKIHKLLGEIQIMKTINVKPNYTELGKRYNLDPRTVKKYCNGYKGKAKSRDKPSKLNIYKEEIKTKLSIPRTSVKSVYEFMVSKYGLDMIGSYSNFRYFVNKNSLISKRNKNASPRYECDPGDMAQVDWKENISLYNRDNKKITFNIFHIVLKYSRYSYIEYSVNKTTEDVFRCIINSFNYFGGRPKTLLIDNMASLVSVNGRNKRILTKAKNFSKDLGFEFRTCKIRSPETKGTNEARNKILDWIRPYNHEFKDEEDLIKIISKINYDMNLEICQGIDVSPVVAFVNEKEYLDSFIEDKTITDAYLSRKKVKVSNESLVYYKKSRYSVNPSLIGQTVELEEFSNRLYIYHNGKIETIHEINDRPINYKDKHYRSLMVNKTGQDKLEETIRNNLAMFDDLLVERKTYKTDITEACKSFNHLCAYLMSNLKSSIGYVHHYLSSLHDNDKELLLTEMGKLLPHIENEKLFLDNIKFYIKDSKIEDIRFNVLLEDSFAENSVLTEEGFESLADEFKDRLSEYYEEKAKGQ